MRKRSDPKTGESKKRTAVRVQDGIFQTRAERDRMREVVSETVRALDLVPPIPKDELRRIAREAARKAGMEPTYQDYVAVLVNNELWRDALARVPMDRRLLLLPKCMRNESDCQGEIDEFGVLCALCGGCAIHDFKSEAERLGYVVLVAEGSPLVMALIETGQVEAVVGVSCLSVLEQVFPYMEAGAVPGVAIPLLHDGCADTHVDLDWVWDAIYLTADGNAPGIDLEALRKEVQGLFTAAELDRTLGPAQSDTERIARDWMTRSGKRWRPFLSACVYQALQEHRRRALPEGLHKLLVAVECFHKASLIHDDIEDEDTERYGEQTLHESYGVPVALNAGDFLLGEGYRLLGELDLSAGQKSAMLSVAATGHRTLCLGQGAELWWQRNRQRLDLDAVLSIFREKTAPAFEVALRLGEIAAGMDHGLGDVLHEYSEALGVAYQIRDDLADSEEDRVDPYRPSVLHAISRDGSPGAEDTARTLLHSYQSRAVHALDPVRSASLKLILRRVIGKIFDDGVVMGCCSDNQAGDASQGGAGQSASR